MYLTIDVLKNLVAEIIKYFEKIDKDLPTNEEKLETIEKVLGKDIISLTNPVSFL